MQHGTLIIPSERAVEICSFIGTKGNLMVQDMNAVSMRRPYRRYVQRIEEMERMLRYLTEEIYKLNGAHIEKNHVPEFLEHDSFVLDGVEESLQTLYTQFVKFRANNDDLLAQRNRAIIEQAVARVAPKSLAVRTRIANTLQTEGTLNSSAPASQSLLKSDVEAAGFGAAMTGFSSFAGVVPQSDLEKFTRTLFRATRGNCYTHVEPLDEDFMDENGQVVKRNVVVVYYQGGPGSALHEKIARTAKAFGIESFDWPKNISEAEQKVAMLQEVIDDKSRALEAFEEFFFDEVAVLLEPIRPNGNSLIEDWRLFCLKQKAIYGFLNLFEETEATLRADCWYPAEEEESTRDMLSDFSGNNTVSAFLLADKDTKRLNPPTYIKTTAFTESFQNIVDTYGVPRYQEVNPALLTIVTFPFLFGVMYGDIGHGGIVCIFGLFLVLAYNKLKLVDEELTQMMLYGRYLILMMGSFAIFSGFVYNDFFSLGVDIFGSRYVEGPVTAPNKTEYVPKGGSLKSPYPFGFDPGWKGAENELDFLNSFKMKFSVIVAFIQMGTGVCLKAFNAAYFNDYLTLFFEFLPQLLFLVALVGYMDFLILYKWLLPYHGEERSSIISSIIGMVMMKKVEPKDQFFSGQHSVQIVLLVLMLLSVPWMLFPKPIIQNIIHKRHASKTIASSASSSVPATSSFRKASRQDESGRNALKPREEEQVPLGGGPITGQNMDTSFAKKSSASDDDDKDEEFEFGEVMIHQLIETIEFVLGAVSNTASYLRLWALSLAHQQLAVVFFENIILNVIKFTVKPNVTPIVPALALFVGFAVFAAITFGILLCMDSLECFLHALRLQWVEFQNKFYKADGYKFVPFSFYRILAGIDNEK